MKWYSVEKKLPFNSWQIVLFTDGQLMGIGYYVDNPQKHGCLEHIEDDEEDNCGIEVPHWHTVQYSQSFKNGQECFGFLDPTKITHWMPLPPCPNKTLHCEWKKIKDYFERVLKVTDPNAEKLDTFIAWSEFFKIFLPFMEKIMKDLGKIKEHDE